MIWWIEKHIPKTHKHHQHWFLEIWNTIFIFDLSRTYFWQINLRVWSFQNLLSKFGFWGIFFYKLIHMFELCGKFFSTNKFLCFNFVEFGIWKINFYILNFLDFFWTNYLLLKKKIENWTWWIVLTNKFLCFNFADCVFGKINFYIWTFCNLFPTFFFIFFRFNL